MGLKGAFGRVVLLNTTNTVTYTLVGCIVFL